jgi:hypothetical protein
MISIRTRVVFNSRCFGASVGVAHLLNLNFTVQRLPLATEKPKPQAWNLKVLLEGRQHEEISAYRYDAPQSQYQRCQPYPALAACACSPWPYHQHYGSRTLLFQAPSAKPVRENDLQGEDMGKRMTFELALTEGGGKHTRPLEIQELLGSNSRIRTGHFEMELKYQRRYWYMNDQEKVRCARMTTDPIGSALVNSLSLAKGGEGRCVSAYLLPRRLSASVFEIYGQVKYFSEGYGITHTLRSRKT